MSRWGWEDQELLRQLREELWEELRDCPPFPEVIGDRKLLRFLNGHGKDVKKAAEMMRNFLAWRRENGVDEIRTNIVERGMNSPLKFPGAQKIFSLIPQVVIAPGVRDRTGAPLSVETYNFKPKDVLEDFSLTEYIRFWIYCLEFKMLVLEELSERKEREILAKYEGDLLPDKWGVLMHLFIIRDLSGFGKDYMTSQGINILRAVISVAQDNYPELMNRCVMVNAPWLFDMLFKLITPVLSPRTLQKILLTGTNYADALEDHLARENFPTLIGGTCRIENEEVDFYCLREIGSQLQQDRDRMLHGDSQQRKRSGSLKRPRSDSRSEFKNVRFAQEVTVITNDENGNIQRTETMRLKSGKHGGLRGHTLRPIDPYASSPWNVFNFLASCMTIPRSPTIEPLEQSPKSPIAALLSSAGKAPNSEHAQENQLAKSQSTSSKSTTALQSKKSGGYKSNRPGFLQNIQSVLNNLVDTEQLVEHFHWRNDNFWFLALPTVLCIFLFLET